MSCENLLKAADVFDHNLVSHHLVRSKEDSCCMLIFFIKFYADTYHTLLPQKSSIFQTMQLWCTWMIPYGSSCAEVHANTQAGLMLAISQYVDVLPVLGVENFPGYINYLSLLLNYCNS